MSATWEGGTLHVRLSSARLLEIGYWILALLLGAVQAWVFRYQPSSVDAISYLDLGDALVQRRWAEALNGYWNPLYAWVLGLVMAVVRPTPQFEYPTAKAVDYAMFVVALICFRWFLKNFLASYRETLGRERGGFVVIPEIAWIGIAYTIFIWSSIEWIRVTSSTPDIAGAALTYVAWGLLYRLGASPRTITYVALGAVLALGYYARTPLFLIGVLVLVLLGFRPPEPDRRRAMVAAAVFALLIAPFVVALSMAHGHLTIGDNGKLNHAWLANPGSYVIPDTNWQGGPSGYGAPRHPTRLIWNALPAFEFATPIGGTYPPWTDPSYWYEGLTLRFDAAKEWKTFVDNLIFYWFMFGRWLLLATTVALAVAGDLNATLRAIPLQVRSWAPAAGGLILHAFANDLLTQWLPAQPPRRYVATFAALLCLVAVSSLRLRPRKLSGPLRVGLYAGMVIVALAALGPVVVEHITELRHGMDLHVRGREGGLYAPWAPWDLAERLQRTGLVAPGARVAIVGEKSRHEYWARLVRARIVAQVPDDNEFWRRSRDERSLILRVLGQSGADVVISSRIRPADTTRADWVVAEGTNYAVRRLDVRNEAGAGN